MDKQVYEEKPWNEKVKIYFDLPLSESAGLAKRMDLMITNDSGMMHISRAVGTKTMAIFGGTKPEYCLAPGAELIRCESKKLKCQPCTRILPMGWKCPANSKCLTLISVDTVYNRAIDILFGDQEAWEA